MTTDTKRNTWSERHREDLMLWMVVMWADFMNLPAFEFSEPLCEGVIVRRRSQFTMDVELENQVRPLHRGRIGSIDVAGRPCLVSLAHGEGRRTAGTVEAVSLARPDVDLGSSNNIGRIEQLPGSCRAGDHEIVEHFISSLTLTRSRTSHSKWVLT